MPGDSLVSILIRLPNKTNAIGCSDNRTIGLMNHALKILFHVFSLEFIENLRKS